MAFTEQDLPKHISEGVAASALEGACLIHKSVKDEPSDLVAGVDQFVYAWCGGERNMPPGFDPQDLPYSLGALWGEQIVREFGWEWKDISQAGSDSKGAVVVASPSRSLVVYPFHYVYDCLAQPDADPTIMLAFNMLKAGKVEEVEGSYTNVMASIYRIVPR